MKNSNRLTYMYIYIIFLPVFEEEENNVKDINKYPISCYL